MTKNKQFFTVIELAKALGVTRAAIYKKINKGQITVENINGRLLIPAQAIEGLVTKELTDKIKAEIDKGVAKVVREYGETLKLLGKE